MELDSPRLDALKKNSGTVRETNASVVRWQRVDKRCVAHGSRRCEMDLTSDTLIPAPVCAIDVAATPRIEKFHS